MARRISDMTPREAREEFNHRFDLNDRDPGPEDSDWDPVTYRRNPMMRPGYGWPLMPPVYPGLGYGPYERPGANRRRDQVRRWGASGFDDRGMMDRAGDEIASWFGDEAAQARREADHRGRGPKGYVRSDPRIEEDVNDRLTDDPDVDASEISVSVKDREITLDGHVDSRWAKRRAEDCADSVAGVVHVQNNLRVQSPDGR